MRPQACVRDKFETKSARADFATCSERKSHIGIRQLLVRLPAASDLVLLKNKVC